MNRLQIILSEQVERAEHLIVLNVKGARGLEVALKSNHVGGLDVELLGGAHLAELLVTLLGRDPRRPPRSAAVVVVRVGVEVLLVLLRTVVEKLRHDYGRCWWETDGWVVVVVASRAVDESETTTKAKQRGRARTVGCVRGCGEVQLQRSQCGRGGY